MKGPVTGYFEIAKATNSSAIFITADLLVLTVSNIFDTGTQALLLFY
jgi:hypothetical protein